MKLRDLEGRLLRCETETSTEFGTDPEFPDHWVFRDKEDNHATMWSKNGPDRITFVPVETVAEAHGVRFLCPKSYAKNGGTKGTHSVYIFFQGSPHAGTNLAGEEVRWNVVGGSTIDDLQLTPSIQEQDDAHPIEHQCNWHGFVGSNGVPPGEAA